MRSSFSHFMSLTKALVISVSCWSVLTGDWCDAGLLLFFKSSKVARPNVTAFAFMSSSVNPVLYVFAGSSHIRQAGLGFMAKLFEGTNSESASTRSSRGSNAESSVFTKLSVKLSRKGDGVRAETPGGEDETMADVHNRDEMKTLTTLH